MVRRQWILMAVVGTVSFVGFILIRFGQPTGVTQVQPSSERAFSLIPPVAAASPAPEEGELADLLALPTWDQHLDRERGMLVIQLVYRADPYIQSAQSLQTMGKEKACKFLRKLAQKDPTYCTWPYYHPRTLTLCRMLFKAKPESEFRRAMLGATTFVGTTNYDDWPLDPIEIVDGIPFLVVVDHYYVCSGCPEFMTMYLDYCQENCDWNDYQFKPRSKAEKEQALKKLLALPRLKGKLDTDDQKFFEQQLK
jgi:hypothetical protein